MDVRISLFVSRLILSPISRIISRDLPLPFLLHSPPVPFTYTTYMHFILLFIPKLHISLSLSLIAHQWSNT